jgi:hypothetical protein
VSSAQAARFNGGGDDLTDIRLDDGTSALVYQVDFCLNRIDTQHFMSLVGAASRRDSADVA